MLDGVMIRTFAHATLTEFAAHSKVPVINGLSDDLHLPVARRHVDLHEHRGTSRASTVASDRRRHNSRCAAAYGSGAEVHLPAACGLPQGYEPKAEFVALPATASARRPRPRARCGWPARTW
ncbi:hypothetical protein ACPA9J_16740 [Pseudomonas aeruginosa]